MSQSFKEIAKPKNKYERKLNQSIKELNRPREINSTEDLIEILEALHEVYMKSNSLEDKFQKMNLKLSNCFIILDQYARKLKSKK